MIFLIIKDFLSCTAAVIFYSLLMNSPKQLIKYTAVISGLGYVIYNIFRYFADSEILGCFAATLFIAISGEILARIKKTPSTIFVFPAIIPLVPGIGLYQTMLKLVQNDYGAALTKGVQTVFIAGAMAVAVAIINVLARFIIPRRNSHEYMAK